MNICNSVKFFTFFFSRGINTVMLSYVIVLSTLLSYITWINTHFFQLPQIMIVYIHT